MAIRRVADRTLSICDHRLGHLYSPVSKMCAHPSGEMWERSSGEHSNPSRFRCATACPSWSVFQ